jgi:spermidine dehydrogenase
MKRKQRSLDKILGIDMEITRRDFLGSMILGAGLSLLDLPAPIELLAQNNSWYGYGGIGDYKESHGDTEKIVSTFRQIQTGRFEKELNNVLDSGKTFDLVIIGGGLSGLAAAHYFKTHSKKEHTCLILENHPIFGGQANRNEFLVNGHKLTGPQASNAFVVIDHPDVPGYEMFEELGVPRKFKYQKKNKAIKALQFDRTSYGFMLWHDISPSVGIFFDDNRQKGNFKLVRDPWSKDMEGSPYSQESRQDFRTWRNSRKRYFTGRNFKQWLDSMSYKEYLEGVMGFSSEVTRFADPVLASGLGLGCDVISAYGAFQISMPGFRGFTGRERKRRLEDSDWHSFPGGNDGFSRYLVKAIVPQAIKGSDSFEDILNRPIDLNALDHPDNKIRIRLGAMAVSVRHESRSSGSEHVSIIYKKNGQLHRVRARGVIMASRGGMNRRIIKDLPTELKAAYDQFHYSPVMVVNVAVTNWRFLYKLGITGCRWFSGFGYSCNIRQPMIVGDFRSPLHPDKPIIITFYVPYHYPGKPIYEQGEKGRHEILSTSYYEYETQIREQMLKLFGNAGFDPKRDIAGIVLNRWIHAYLNPQPGYYFGLNGKPAARETVRKGFGKIAFGHSEMDGHQNWSGAMNEGRKAAERILEML